jgi:Tol biopolymer transport system component
MRSIRFCIILFMAPVGVTTLAPQQNAYGGETTRVSVNSSGTQANNGGSGPSISADGRFVAFQSGATNLLVDEGDFNGAVDIFVHDRQTGQTSRRSLGFFFAEANASSFAPSLSADGRVVAFESLATNLVAGGDTNEKFDVFVHGDSDLALNPTARVSVGSSGNQGDEDSVNASISADGRFVAFDSEAANLVAGDTNEVSDVFVHDRQTGVTTRVSVDSSGTQGDEDSEYPSISADGRFVVFASYAANLVSGDSNFEEDIFVHDRQTGVTTRVSVDSSGTQGNGQSAFPAISANGRFVAFPSVATNLVGGDSNESSDVFVHDRQTGETTRVSVNSSGTQGNDYSGFLGNRDTSLSADGRFVAFVSRANNLVPGDTNGAKDVFVHDRVCRTTIRVNVDSFSNQGNGTSAGFSSATSISADGRFVAFDSDDPTLVAGDTNGRLDVFVHENNRVSPVVVFQLCQIDYQLTAVLADVEQAGLNPGLTDQLVTRLTKVQRFNEATSAACVVGHQIQATEKFKTAKGEVDKFVKTLKKEQASVGLVPEEDPLNNLILQGNGLSNQMQGVLNTGVCS